MMDMGFRLLTILKTINTKPPRSREHALLPRIRKNVLFVSAILFFIISIACFDRFLDGEGLAFLVLALLCMAGVGLERLVRHSVAATLLAGLLALGIMGITLLGSSRLVMCMWALLFPAVAFFICGLKSGGLISGALAIHFAVLFSTPVQPLLPVTYPQEVAAFYPLLYVAVTVLFYVFAYQGHKNLLHRQSSEDALRKTIHDERDHLMIMMTQTILSISNAVDARDTYTQRHSARVAEYSVMLAKALGWDAPRLDQLYSIALLHDIGKIGISDSVLNKHASLTAQEREIIKQHTVIGGEILKDLTLLPNASVGAVCHHERYDGTGYPYGLKGRQIPLEARIIGIADAFDAMNSSRVYRARMSSRQIMQELQGGKGSQFDPELLELFLPIARQVLEDNIG
ncbi:MAG: HD-GYP domain-containing protein [Aristaeellaceae bacterium]